MGLFDFLKKKEFDEIATLKNQIAELNKELEIYGPIKELEKELTIKKQEINGLVAQQNELNENYKKSLEIFTKLRKEVNIYESKLDTIEFGIYEPVYDFEKSDEYREEQNRIVENQKKMIQDDTAAICTTSWTVHGSEAKGRAMVKTYKKLMLRAFNGECDSLIAKVKWNNVNQMKERMAKLFESINKLGKETQVYITSEYLELKKSELILEYEYQAKRQKEKDELRRIQEEMREEEKVRREIEQAQKEAEKEEINYQKALEKARKEMEQATGEKHDKLLAQIAQLEEELKEAQEKKERAMSMAQQTKRGHVYIISNIGSFGESVYKIGMTRRLEPLDRIKELGDASVPFSFDVHAMIFSDDAPSLELELHKKFEKNSVNLVNLKKEFFRVSLNDIEEAVKTNGVDAEFVRLPEAMEFRETMAILEKMKNKSEEMTIEEKIREDFPETLN